MKKVRAALCGSVLFTALMIVPDAAQAHRIYQLQGNQWAIICDNGTGYSFSGSQTGAGEVAGILCGASTNVASGGAVTVGTLMPADRHVQMVEGRWQRTGVGHQTVVGSPRAATAAAGRSEVEARGDCTAEARRLGVRIPPGACEDPKSGFRIRMLTSRREACEEVRNVATGTLICRRPNQSSQ